MKPILFQLGNVLVPSFGFFFSLGFIVPYLLLRRQTRQDGWAPGEIESLMIRLFLGGVVGARALYVVEAWPFFAAYPLEAPMVWKGGLSFFGGLFGVFVVGLHWARSRGIGALELTDRFVIFGALGHMFGRVGCLSHGCCFGEPTLAPWGLAFPQVSGDHLARHPTQAYEALLLGLLVIVVYRTWLSTREIGGTGRATALYLMGYGAIRLTIEHLRGDSTGANLTILKPYQMVGLLCIALGAAIRIRAAWVSYRSP